VTSDLEQPLNDEDDDEGLDAPTSPVRRSPRIGQADVFGAADELLLEGNRPTIDRVRMRLGRGSPNTINEHLDAWWLKLGARLRDIPGREFPQLPERTAQALLTLWNEALEGAQDTLRGSIGARESEVAARDEALSAAAAALSERETALAARAGALRHRPQIKVRMNHLVGHVKGTLLGAGNQPDLHQGVDVFVHALDVPLERPGKAPHAAGP
jgi:hypothetical protein